MLEKKIERAVSEYARGKGFLAYKFSSPSHAGVCDRIFIAESCKVIFAEFKATGMKPTPLQSRHHQELAKRYLAVYVIDSIALGKEIIDYELEQGWAGHHRAAVRYVGSKATLQKAE